MAQVQMYHMSQGMLMWVLGSPRSPDPPTCEKCLLWLASGDFCLASTEVHHTLTLLLGSSLILRGSTAPGPIRLNSRLAPYQWDLDLVR